MTLPLRSDGKISIPSHIRRVKLDVGLSINAPHSHLWIQQNPNDLLVFGFEPNTSAIEQLKGLKPYDAIWPHRIDPKLIGTKLILLNCALGDCTEKVNLYITEPDAGCSSLFLPKTIKLKSVQQVCQFRLEEFFDLFPFDQIPYIEYLKIDAQGSDLKILKGCGKYLERVVYVTAEPEESAYLNVQNSLAQIQEYMTSMGFEKISHPNTVDPTFVNSKFLSEAQSIYICQIG